MLKILKGEPAAVKSLVFCVVLHRSVFVLVVSVLLFTGLTTPLVSSNCSLREIDNTTTK